LTLAGLKGASDLTGRDRKGKERKFLSPWKRGMLSGLGGGEGNEYLRGENKSSPTKGRRKI